MPWYATPLGLGSVCAASLYKRFDARESPNASCDKCARRIHAYANTAHVM